MKDTLEQIVSLKCAILIIEVYCVLQHSIKLLTNPKLAPEMADDYYRAQLIIFQHNLLPRRFVSHSTKL